MLLNNASAVALVAVYLFIGLIGMMLMLASVYDVPELNIGYHFYMRSDDEEAVASSSVNSAGERTQLRVTDKPKYAAAQENAGFRSDANDADKAQLTSKQ